MIQDQVKYTNRKHFTLLPLRRLSKFATHGYHRYSVSMIHSPGTDIRILIWLRIIMVQTV